MELYTHFSRIYHIEGRMNLTGARLVGSNLPYEGQLLLNGNSFCDPKWSFGDADTACQQLGYPGTSAENWRCSSIGVRDNSVGDVPEVRSFMCTGNESSLSLCPQTVDDAAVCSSQNYIKVTCK